MGGHYAPITADCINPFLTAATNVFRTMAACELTRGKPFLAASGQPTHDISGVIGLSGKAIGTVVVSLERQVALHVAQAMLGEMPPDLNRDVVDAIGELTNMIAGSAKSQLEQFAMSLSMPSVIMGRNHSIAFPGEVTPIAIPFDCKWGPVCVQVGLCRKTD